MKDALIAAENGSNGMVPICEIDGLLRELISYLRRETLIRFSRRCSPRRFIWLSWSTNTGRQPALSHGGHILEEIVGSIMDEYDVDEEFIAQAEDGSYIISGMAPLDEGCQNPGYRIRG